MTPFLRQAAAHYISLGQIDRTCLIFPSRRAAVFFTKYLRELLQGRGKPVILPKMMTESEFFEAAYGHPVSDKLSLLLELYSVYKEYSPRAESLDEFVFWGDVILSDFSDVDKYLVDPKQLFTNVADLKNLQDTFSYLSDEQRKAINSFLSHFRDGGDILPEGKAVYKDRFLGLWNLLLPIYERFRERLAEKGMAYDGMIYRSVAERFASESATDILAGPFNGVDLFGFIGLNALSKCEKEVLGALRDAHMADFSWDYCGKMIRDRHNRSSFFMEGNVAEFPMTWTPEDVPDAPAAIKVVSVPSAVGQAKMLPLMAGGNADATAIVLPDESLLEPVLNSIPPEIEKINVTMGLPLSGSRFHSLMSEVANLQLRQRVIKGETYFYHKNVWSILTGGIAGQLLSEEEATAVKELKAAGKYYIPASDLVEIGPLATAIFRPLALDLKSSDEEQVKKFGEYLSEIIRLTASKIVAVASLATEAEFAIRWYGCVRNLLEKELPVTPSTYVKLLLNLLSMQSVPFEGEPIGGLQIMGPLETRALDFDNVIILSCNEGSFPRRSISSSFIPPALRTAFGLPTYEFQDAIWAYYFYRMICRASTVWLLYDSRSEGGHSGEESRYIKQLQYHFRVPLCRMTSGAGIQLSEESDSIPKPENIVDILKGIRLSASSMNSYLSCPAKFYYSAIEKLSPEGEVTESLDSGMIGNVFHETMQALYLGPEACSEDFSMERRDVAEAIRSGRLKPLKTITPEYIDFLLGREGRKLIHQRIEASIRSAIHSPVVTGRNLVFADIILSYVVRTLNADKSIAPFDILGLELYREWNFEGYKFVGYIDRLDRVGDSVRIVDYKTGRDDPKDVLVDNAGAMAEKVFSSAHSRPKIPLQLFLYDMFVLSSDLIPNEANPKLINCMYSLPRIRKTGFTVAPVNYEFCSLVKDGLRSVLAEIASPGIPFRRTDDHKTCEYCDFKTICGR